MRTSAFGDYPPSDPALSGDPKEGWDTLVVLDQQTGQTWGSQAYGTEAPGVPASVQAARDRALGAQPASKQG